ncbi:hypothetical protein MHU86_11804 [Fragilaria crotonensis]|nr:hypothetical protein MHU86_11804 [Fragilaria crotonensis]
MSSCETIVDTSNQSVPTRRLSGESSCDLYADVERTLHLRKEVDNRSADRAHSKRRAVEGSERKLSPRPQKDSQKSDVASNFHRSPSAPELQSPRKSSVDSVATKASIPALYEYEVAPESDHNAEPRSNSPTSDTGSTLSEEEQEIIRFLMKTTSVRHSMRSLSPKTAHSRACSTGIEGVARRNSDRDYCSRSRGNLSQKGTVPLQEARNARMASSQSRPRQLSFGSQASEPNRSSSRSRPRQQSFDSPVTEPNRTSSRSRLRQQSVDSPVTESNRTSSRSRPRQQSFDSQTSDPNQTLPRSRPRQQSFDSHASDLNQSVRSKAGGLRRRKRASRRRASDKDPMTSLSPPSSRELIAQPSVSHLVERHHSESSSRQTDLGQISATAGCTSRSAPDLGSPLRKRMPRVPTGNREHDKSNCKEGKEKSKRRDKSKDKSKCKDKTKTREKTLKKLPNQQSDSLAYNAKLESEARRTLRSQFGNESTHR